MEQFYIPDYWKCTDLKDAFGEEWKWINKYDGAYQLSNYGRIKSFRKPTPAILKLMQNPKPKGYIYISLYENSKAAVRPIHQLILETFFPELEPKKEVNHIDGNKTNNFWWNLEWNTSSENKIHAFATGLNKHYGENNNMAKLTTIQVMDIFNSELNRKELAEKYNVHEETIYQIKVGKIWSNATGKKFKAERRFFTKDEVLGIFNSTLSYSQTAKKFNTLKRTVARIKKGVRNSSVTGIVYEKNLKQ